MGIRIIFLPNNEEVALSERCIRVRDIIRRLCLSSEECVVIVDGVPVTEDRIVCEDQKVEVVKVFSVG